MFDTARHGAFEEMGRSAEHAWLRAEREGRHARGAIGTRLARFDSRARSLVVTQPLIAFGLAFALGYALGCARRR